MDELTPPFEEPTSSSPDDCDEAVDGAAESYSGQFDLTTWLDPEDMILGWTGSIKYMTSDGGLEVAHVYTGLSHYEAIGMNRMAAIHMTTDED